MIQIDNWSSNLNKKSNQIIHMLNLKLIIVIHFDTLNTKRTFLVPPIWESNITRLTITTSHHAKGLVNAKKGGVNTI